MKSEYDKLFYQHQNMVQFTPSQQQSVQTKDSVLFTHRVPSQVFTENVDLNLAGANPAVCTMCTTRDGKPFHGQGDQPVPKSGPTNSELALKEIIDQIQKVYPKQNHRSKISKGKGYEIREDDEENSSHAFDENSDE